MTLEHRRPKFDKGARRKIFLVGMLLSPLPPAWSEENLPVRSRISSNHTASEMKDVQNDVDFPENREEDLRATALEESVRSARAQHFPSGKLVFEESRVYSEGNSGLLTFAQIEIPFYQGKKSISQSAIARFEKESFRAYRTKLNIERLFQFQSDYYEARTLQGILSIQQQIGDILSDLISRGETLVDSQLKSKSELLSFHREVLLNTAVMKITNARLEVLKNRLAYSSGEKNPRTFDFSQVKLDDTLPNPDDLVSALKNRVQKYDPDLQRLRAEKDKQEAKIRLVESERLPEILAVVRYTQDPRFAGTPDQTFAGIRFEENLWGFGALTHQIRKEQFSLAAQNQLIENEERRLALRFDETIQLYKGSYNLWKSQESCLELFRQAMDEALHKFNTGESSWKQYALAKQEYLNQCKEVESARFEALKGKSELWCLFGPWESIEGKP